MYRAVFQREPSVNELRLGAAFIKAQTEAQAGGRRTARVALRHGGFDAKTQRTAKFTAFTTFEQSKWHGGRRLTHWP